jgi:hypothetical protein
LCGLARNPCLWGFKHLHHINDFLNNNLINQEKTSFYKYEGQHVKEYLTCPKRKEKNLTLSESGSSWSLFLSKGIPLSKHGRILSPK